MIDFLQKTTTIEISHVFKMWQIIIMIYFTLNMLGLFFLYFLDMLSNYNLKGLFKIISYSMLFLTPTLLLFFLIAIIFKGYRLIFKHDLLYLFLFLQDKFYYYFCKTKFVEFKNYEEVERAVGYLKKPYTKNDPFEKRKILNWLKVNKVKIDEKYNIIKTPFDNEK